MKFRLWLESVRDVRFYQLMESCLYLESEVISAEEVLRIVMNGFYQKKNKVNPEVYVRRFGIQGDFEKRIIPVATLVKMANTRRLYISPSKTEQGVIDKINSGERNPVIITMPEDHPFKFMVVDGTHSLDAAARAGDKNIEVIMPVGVELY